MNIEKSDRRTINSGSSSKAQSVARGLPPNILYKKSIYDRKQLIAFEIIDRKKGKLKVMIQNIVMMCRIIIFLSPSLDTNFKKQNENGWIYYTCFVCNTIVLLKIMVIVRQKKRHYFRKFLPSIDLIAILGSFLGSLVFILNLLLDIDSNNFDHYYFWAICCMMNVLAIFNRLQKFKLIAETFSIIMLAVKMNYPFITFIVVFYMQSAIVGCYMFGGHIHSLTPDSMSMVGQSIKREFVYQNWNDLFNSIVFLWGLNLGNNSILLVDMSVVAEGPARSHSSLFFFFFYLFNHILIRNILIGQIIEISLEYFKVANQEDKRASVVADDSTPTGLFNQYLYTYIYI